MSRNVDEEELFRKLHKVSLVGNHRVDTIKTRESSSNWRLTKRNRSDDELFVSVSKTPLVPNASSPFRRIGFLPSAEESVDRRAEEEPFNLSDPVSDQIVFINVIVLLFTISDVE